MRAKDEQLITDLQKTTLGGIVIIGLTFFLLNADDDYRLPIMAAMIAVYLGVYNMHNNAIQRNQQIGRFYQQGAIEEHGEEDNSIGAFQPMPD